MTPDHGTRARYLRGCHCDDCRAAQARYTKVYRYRTTAAPIRVDVAPVIAHLAALVASGLSLCDIASEAATDSGRLSRIRRGRQRTIHPQLAARILAVAPIPDPASVIDEVAIERVLTGNATVDTLTRSERHAARVEAARRGWTATEIAQRLRVSGSYARRLVEAVTS